MDENATEVPNWPIATEIDICLIYLQAKLRKANKSASSTRKTAATSVFVVTSVGCMAKRVTYSYVTISATHFTALLFVASGLA